jgi:hypothetical protein
MDLRATGSGGGGWGVGWAGSENRPVGWCCEHGDEPSDCGATYLLKYPLTLVFPPDIKFCHEPCTNTAHTSQ